jgi:hypothetical protein
VFALTMNTGITKARVFSWVTQFGPQAYLFSDLGTCKCFSNFSP